MIGNIAAGLYGVGVTPSTSSYESIATATGTGSSGTITFNTTALTSYKHLQIRGFVFNSSDYNSTYLQFNGDTGNNYAWHSLLGDGSVARAQAASTTNKISMGPTWNGSLTTYPTGFVCDILDAFSTTKYKTTRNLSGVDYNGNGDIDLISGLWQNTNAITEIKLYFLTGNFTTNTKISLYGIKD